MHFLDPLWRIIWVARVALEAILLAFLVRRKIYQEFRAFVLLTGWEVCLSTILLIMDVPGVATGAKYYQVLSIRTAGDAVLSFAVLYELFKRVLRDYPVLTSVGRSLYRWAILLFVMIALGLAWSAPASGSGTLVATFLVMQRTVRLLECGLLVFLFIFARSFGLSWRNRAFGIALGLGVAASVSLATSAIGSQIEPGIFSGGTPATVLGKDLYQLLNQVGDLSAVLVWMKYLLAREKALAVPLPALPAHDLKTWNQEIRKMVP